MRAGRAQGLACKHDSLKSAHGRRAVLAARGDCRAAFQKAPGDLARPNLARFVSRWTESTHTEQGDTNGRKNERTRARDIHPHHCTGAWHTTEWRSSHRLSRRRRHVFPGREGFSRSVRQSAVGRQDERCYPIRPAYERVERRVGLRRGIGIDRVDGVERLQLIQQCPCNALTEVIA